MATIGCLNEQGEMVDLYIPRKCNASNTLITAYDASSVHIQVADIDANGRALDTTTTFSIAGFLRKDAEADHAINRLCISNGLIRPRTAKPKKAKKAKKPAQKAAAAAPAKGKGKAAAAAPAKGKGKAAAAAPAKGKKPAAAAEKKAAAPAEKKPQGKKPAAKKTQKK